MPAQDKFLESVLRALIKEGWTITDQEVQLPFDATNSYVDFLAERTLIAERGTEKIAVEVKTFAGKSVLSELEKALGQFLIYKTCMVLAHMEHELYLAAPADMLDFFKRPAATELRKNYGIKVVIYDATKEEILEWIEP